MKRHEASPQHQRAVEAFIKQSKVKEVIKKQYLGEGTSTRAPETYYSNSKQQPVVQAKQPAKAASNLLGQDLFDDDLLTRINGESVEEPSQETSSPIDKGHSPIVAVESNIIEETQSSPKEDVQLSESTITEDQQELKELLYFKKKKF